MFSARTAALAAALPLLAGWASCALAGGLADYGKGDEPWREAFRQLGQSREGKVRIVQIGDSHTAGDFFSDAARRVLQQAYGRGGIGFVYPGKPAGTQLQTVSYRGSGWTVTTSRKGKGDFPAGGVIARSAAAGSRVSVRPMPAYRTAEPQRVSLLLKSPSGAKAQVAGANGKKAEIAGGAAWTLAAAEGGFTLPLTVSNASGGALEVGAVGIENGKPGVVYSAFGILGSMLSDTKGWRKGWAQDLAAMKPDLVVLSFGTNESFADAHHFPAYRKAWESAVDAIRKAAPAAGILIVGAPETLKNTAGACGTRSKSLARIQLLQKSVAKAKGTLYWSWEEDGMGGACSMKKWIGKKLAQKDGIHFTKEGYALSGRRFGEALKALFAPAPRGE